MRFFSKMVSIWDVGLSLGFPGCPWPPFSVPVFQVAGIVGVYPNTQFLRFLFKTELCYTPRVLLNSLWGQGQFCSLLFETWRDDRPVYLMLPANHHGPLSLISRALGSTSRANIDMWKLFQIVTLWEHLLWGCQSHFNTHNTAMAFQCGASNKFQSFLQSALASLREGTLSQSLKKDESLVEARGDWGFWAYGCRCLDVSAHAVINWSYHKVRE